MDRGENSHMAAQTSELQSRLAAETDSSRRVRLIKAALRPPEPQLLDTCVLQNLDWVDREIEANGGRVAWDELTTAQLARRFGAELAEDLIALGVLYKQFESDSGYPWLVCRTAVQEAPAS